MILRFILTLCMTISLSKLSNASVDSNIPAYKIAVAQKVFDDLKAAKGIYPHEPPFFKMEKTFKGKARNLKLAYIEYATSEIHLQEKVYNICSQQLGPDSLAGLAFILGHEIAHYSNHDTQVSHHAPELGGSILEDSTFLVAMNGVFGDVNDEDFKTIDASVHQYMNRKSEAKADLHGGFLAYMAGYYSDKEKQIPAKFLEEVYAQINMSRMGARYPSLEERKIVAATASNTLDSLIHIFDMGNYMAAIKHYADAAIYYTKVSQTFQSRELFNNVGAVLLKGVRDCLKSKGLKLETQSDLITLDVNSRLGQGGKNVTPYSDQQIHDDLLYAIDYFEKSIYYDDEYPIAHLNLSIAKYLQARFNQQLLDEEAEVDFKVEDPKELIIQSRAACINAKNIVKDNIEDKNVTRDSVDKVEDRHKLLLSNSYLHWSRVESLDNNSEKEKEYMALASKWLPNNKNLKPISSTQSTKKCEKEEMIGSQNTSDFLGDLPQNGVSKDVVFQGKGRLFDKLQTLELFETDLATVYYNWSRLELESQQEVFVFKPSQKTATACSIALGDNVTQLETNYGVPTNTVTTSSGSYQTYETFFEAKTFEHLGRGIVFELDAHDNVKDWFYYIRSRDPVD